MSRYIAAYDIADNRTRTTVARILQRYGQRVQESVFELHLDPDELPDLRIAVGSRLSKLDCFDLYPIDDTGQRPHCRWQRPIEPRRAVLLL